MTFAELAEKIFIEAREDFDFKGGAKGLKSSQIGSSAFNPQIATPINKKLGVDRPGASIIYGNEGPITESFGDLVDYYLTEAKKGARCTKVTGQQSSSRSDKKYMRCARVDGKLKRIHYGDPNLRIKKSNPKKRKSFRARHKCSSAKPGTAKYYSCKNW